MLRRSVRQQRRLTIQFCRSLDLMVHALRVGTSFHQALDRVAEEADLPLAQEWKRLAQALKVGVPMAQALTEFKQRIHLRVADWFTTAVQVTLQAGGSLAGVLEHLANSLREREALAEKLAALTAQGKASAI